MKKLLTNEFTEILYFAWEFESLNAFSQK